MLIIQRCKIPRIKVNCDNPDNILAQNYILHDRTAKKIPGTHRYNPTALDNPITWAERYYGIKANGDFTKKAFCFSSGKVYMGDDTLQSLTMVKGGLQENAKVESLTVQVAGNSRMYIFDGYNIPIYYEGNDMGAFYDSAITYKFQQGVIKDGRLFAFERNSSVLAFSRPLYPEDFSATYAGEIIVGNVRESFIRRIILIGNDLYVFKNDSIWVLRGSTKATYDVDLLVPEMGLLAQRAISMLGSAYVIVCQQDKEIYEFNGTPNLRLISKDILGETFSDKIDKIKTDDIECCNDTINKLFRLSYNEKEVRETYMNNEIVFPTDEFNANGQPKWSETYGAAISCYSVWNKQGDHTLVTGRADIGCLMYHNRGHNWDTEAIECILRTDDVIAEPGYNCQYNSIFVRGTPSNGTVTLMTFLDARNTVKTEQNISDKGERKALGAINISSQASFHNWIPFLTGFDLGESVSIEIYDKTLNKDIEIEDIIVDYETRDEIRNSLIG